MGREKILIVEDDEILSYGVKLNLSIAHFEAETAKNRAEALQKLRAERFDLLIMDVNLPDGNGFALAGEIREKYDIPIIFLTAKDMDEDIMTGFESGADDYVTKPFNVQILIQRVRAVLNRYSAGKKAEERVCIGNLEIDFAGHEVLKSKKPLSLTPTEFKLLKKFCENPGIVLTRSVLLEALWDKDGDFVDEHTLTIFVSRLRGKIADEEYTYIKTIYGTGYQWRGER